MLLVNPATRFAIANAPDPEGKFQKYEGVFIGTFPEKFTASNTASMEAAMEKQEGLAEYTGVFIALRETGEDISPGYGMQQGGGLRPGYDQRCGLSHKLSAAYSHGWVNREILLLTECSKRFNAHGSRCGEKACPKSYHKKQEDGSAKGCQIGIRNLKQKACQPMC